jgi:hypothetical protein
MSAVSGAAITTRNIVGGLIVAIGLGGAVDGLATFFSLPVRRSISVAIATTILYHALKLWLRQMRRLGGMEFPAASLRRHSFALAILFVGVGFALGVTEPFIVARGALVDLRIHHVYMILFTASTALLSALFTYSLASGMTSGGNAVRWSVVVGAACALVFLGVALVMDRAGWRVGAPRAAERATMLVVTALGLVAAAVSGGAILGRLLSGSSRNSAKFSL